MYRRQVRRRRLVLGGLVILAFILLSVTFGSGSGRVGTALGDVFGPVQDVADGALKPGRDLVNWFDETFEARGDRERLSRQLATARADAVAGKVALAENRQLRQLLGLERQGRLPAGRRLVDARVISRSPTLWFSSVGIDRGSVDGIAVDDTVIEANGLVGVVSSVSRNTSVVTLLTDGASAASAEILPQGAQGIIRARIGAPGELVLEFIDDTAGIVEGQAVVTAGWRSGNLSSLFPPNIPIGEIEKAPITRREAIQSVDVESFVDFRNLDLVQVLARGGAG